MTRAEHLKWCKERALKYVEKNNLQEAFASMASDLGMYPETENHGAITLGLAMLMSNQLTTPEAMREFIEGFN